MLPLLCALALFVVAGVAYRQGWAAAPLYVPQVSGAADPAIGPATGPASGPVAGPATQEAPEALRLAPIRPAAAVLAPVGAGPLPRSRAVRAAVAAALKDPALGAHVGLVVHDLASGRPLLSIRGQDRFIPASTTKLFTVAAALRALPPDTRFSTRAVAAPGIRRIVLVGGGDPLLARKAPPGASVDEFPRPASMARLAADTARALHRRDVRSVRLGLDATLFAGPPASPHWKPAYVRRSVVSPISALWVDEGRTAGSATRSRDPVRAGGLAFAAGLRRHGIVVRGPLREMSAPRGAKPLAAVHSAPLDQIVERVLSLSDNEAAEVLLRQVALSEGRVPSFAGGVQATRDVLRRLGVDVSGVRLYDGSGLSRDNRVPLTTLVDLIDLGAKTADLRPLVSGLPVARFSGSLGYRFTAARTASAGGLVRAKTGTLSRVHLLAGVAVTPDGDALSFAVAADRVRLADTQRARDALDRLTARLAGCTCS
jgi:D-alanyl-D-alanine carboxypeptidase/D-alanyl-D-alanine-endopeptidase (penicillin-binding protein 4)